MIILIKILIITAFVFSVLLLLSLSIRTFALFFPPILIATLISFAISALTGAGYYWENNILFYSHLSLIFLAVLTGILFIICPFFAKQFLWIFRIWAIILLVFYGLNVF